LAAIVLAGVLVLLLAVAAEHADATPKDASALELKPASGPPGTDVAVTVTGYSKCQTYVVNVVLDEAIPGTVAVSWDGVEKDHRTVSDGSVSLAFDIPASATPGKYPVVSTCRQNTEISDTDWFVVTAPPEPAMVPNVIGMGLDQAKRTIVGKKLTLGRTTGEGDTVQSQDPVPGTEVEVGDPVDIDLGTVSPPPAVVPDVVRLSRAKAAAALELVGLRLGRVSGRGTVVLSQSPGPGTTVDPHSAVDITLGSLPQFAIVPRLIGLTTDTASTVLARRRLVLGQVSGDGEVIRKQLPKSGTRVLVGSAVNVTTRSDLVLPKLIQVPDLVGRKVAVARVTLAAVGLVLGGTPADDRIVASQAPVAGTLIPLRKVVTVTLVAPPMVRVPDLADSKVSGARTELSALGLVFGGTADSDRDIVGQQPAAGTLVPVGTTVTVTFAQSPPLAALAALSALVLGSAGAIYRGLRQRLDQRWVRNKLRIVVRQAPAAGPKITESNSAPSPPVVRIEPHGDTGRHFLEEI
jgi:beta-lactam-binding protein with PASTA domain